MNAQKLLKSPVAVIVLCLAAAGMIFFNVVLPLISEDTGIAATAPVPESAPVAPSAAPAMDAGSGGPAQPVAAVNNPNSLRIIGWKLSVSRDPFKAGKNRMNAAPSSFPGSAAPPEIGSAPGRKQPSPRQAAARPRSFPADQSLQAIMNGPAGKSALIGTRMVREGDTCGSGIVTKITANSVILKTPRGSRELRLANRDRGETP